MNWLSYIGFDLRNEPSSPRPMIPKLSDIVETKNKRCWQPVQALPGGLRWMAEILCQRNKNWHLRLSTLRICRSFLTSGYFYWLLAIFSDLRVSRINFQTYWYWIWLPMDGMRLATWFSISGIWAWKSVRRSVRLNNEGYCHLGSHQAWSLSQDHRDFGDGWDQCRPSQHLHRKTALCLIVDECEENQQHPIIIIIELFARSEFYAHLMAEDILQNHLLNKAVVLQN